jgi:glycosyltransferase involved in cell wall biosynthesis
MKVCEIIPTLNEEKNIEKIFIKIKKTKIKLDILFLDDNSDDGSNKEILDLRKKDKKVNYIFRKNKIGISLTHKNTIKNKNYI